VKEKIDSCLVVSANSKKTGNNYTYLELKFKNGYIFRPLLTNEQKYILSSLSPVDTSEKIEVKTGDPNIY